MSPGNCYQNSPAKVEEEEIFAEEKKQPKVNFVKKNEERLREIQEQRANQIKEIEEERIKMLRRQEKLKQNVLREAQAYKKNKAEKDI